MKHFSIITTALILIAFTGMQPKKYEVSPESTMQIAGGSSMHDWSCDVVSKGWMELGSTPGMAPTSVEITASVEEIECGKGVMNRKLRKALLSDDHPQILFRSKNLKKAESGQLEVTGVLSVAGVDKELNISLQESTPASDTLKYMGSADLLMSDFGISPPSAMLGAMKTHDPVTVSFSIVMTPSN